MRPLAEMPEAVAANAICVLADIDDTITTDGRLTADAYAALERLAQAGLLVALVTGRPAGWCDMMARLFPVHGVVGENGAFYFAHDASAHRMVRVFAASAAERAAARERLGRVRERVLAEVPAAAVSADQLYRETDLAIDFAEDVAAMLPVEVAQIKSIFESEGAVAKISSIHVNGWFGSWDKLTMSRRFAAERLAIDIDAERERVVYCGDSPNDALMFGFFPNACGVANVRDFAGTLDAEPAWVAKQRGGAGFVEIAERLLAARARMRREPRKETA